MLYHEVQSWKDDFFLAIQQNDLRKAISIIDAQRTPHAGTPPKAVKMQAVRLIQACDQDNPEALFALAIAFSQAGSDGAKEIALKLLPPFYHLHSKAVCDCVLALSDDPNWEVREWAASALGSIITIAFEMVYPTLKQWKEHESPNVRRAVVVSIGSAARNCNQEQCSLLLEVLEPLLADTHPYVSKNLGPFAIGDSLLRYHPILVADWLNKALHNENEQARWNIAMVMSAAESARHFPLLRDLLSQLATDTRPFVRRAVCKAFRKLGQRIPEELLPLLEEWKADPERASISAEVLPVLESYTTARRERACSKFMNS
jgi:3-methyladenine DNA glycosylase AlkD